MDNYTPITDVVFQKAEYSLARLLSIYLDNEDLPKMLTLSRSINGGIISFAEHPLFYNIETLPLKEAESKTWAKETLRDYILNSIKTYQ
ncbi:MAG: hypothetical protein LUF92_01185 [Clostridiales bacterium]|nr:hypothetical protein [Clostridiales bacterium]